MNDRACVETGERKSRALKIIGLVGQSIELANIAVLEMKTDSHILTVLGINSFCYPGCYGAVTLFCCFHT